VALPKRRHSRTRQAKRRTHWKPLKTTTTRCANCEAPKRPHRVCASCGHYGGREITTPELA